MKSYTETGSHETFLQCCGYTAKIKREIACGQEEFHTPALTEPKKVCLLLLIARLIHDRDLVL